MHSYSIDSDARRTTYFVLALTSVFLPNGVALLNERLSAVLSSSPNLAWPLGMGATFGILFFVFDRYVWKVTIPIHHVPNLNGIWDGKGVSSHERNADDAPSAEFSLTVTVRQTFTRIEVSAESRESTSRSTMANICSDRAITRVRYAFENTPKAKATPDLLPHPGLIELRMNGADTMVGDYFSGKHRLKFGELSLTRRAGK